MTDSREHKCPRCGASLPTVTVKVPVYIEHLSLVSGQLVSEMIPVSYEEHEEPGECFRCTGSY